MPCDKAAIDVLRETACIVRGAKAALASELFLTARFHRRTSSTSKGAVTRKTSNVKKTSAT